jgi:hypothetical protein
MPRSNNPTASDFFEVCLRHFPEPQARVASELLFWSQFAEHTFRGRTGFYKENRELGEKIGKHPKSVGRILRKFCALVGEDRPDALFIIDHGPKPRARSGRVRWLSRTPRGDELVIAAQKFAAERQLAAARRGRKTRGQNVAIEEHKAGLSVSAKGPDRSPQNVATHLKQKHFSDSQTDTLSSAEAERETESYEEKGFPEGIERFARLWKTVCEECNRPTLAWRPSEVRGWSSKLSKFIQEMGVAETPDEDVMARLRVLVRDFDSIKYQMSRAFERYNTDGLHIESFVRYSTKLWLAAEKRLEEERKASKLKASNHRKSLSDMKI